MLFAANLSLNNQPQAPMTLNGAGIGVGLQMAIVASQGLGVKDLARGDSYNPLGTVALTVTSAGQAWTFGSNATDGITTFIGSGIQTWSNPQTLGVVFIPTALTAGNTIFTVGRSTAANNASRYGLRVAANGTSLAYYSATSGGVNVEIATPNNLVVGGVNVAVGTYISNTARQAFLNGQASALDTAASIHLVGTTAASTTLGTATGTTRTTGQGGSYLLAVCWNRILPFNEIASFSTNPWQIFAPAVRRNLWLQAIIDQLMGQACL
jgi:hypothetical protein